MTTKHFLRQWITTIDEDKQIFDEVIELKDKLQPYVSEDEFVKELKSVFRLQSSKPTFETMKQQLFERHLLKEV